MKFEKKSMNVNHFQPTVSLYYPRFLLSTVKTIDSRFVPIPTLRRDNSGIEPCQVGIPTSPDKVRIPTLSWTILELSRFLLCAELCIHPLSHNPELNESGVDF